MKNFKQQKPYYCGPASLRIVQELLGFDRLMTQDEWAYIAKTRENKGTSIANLKRCVGLMGKEWRVAKDWDTFNRFLLDFPISIVYDAQRDHWLVVKLDNSFANWESGNDWWIFDPDSNGRRSTMTLADFKSHFFANKTKSYALMVG
jgi:hypothetical protein